MPETARDHPHIPQKQRQLLILCAIFCLALLIRLIGIRFGFPLLIHTDEESIMTPLLSMTEQGSLDSGFYYHPDQLSYTLLFVYLNLVSRLVYGTNLAIAYPQDPLLFYFHARLLSVIFGALIPVVAWLIGRSFHPLDFSWAAAFLTCFYSPYITHATYITPDVLITLLTLLVILFCLKYLDTTRERWLALACVLVALNTVEKYPAILSFGIVVVALLIRAFSLPEPSPAHRLKFLASRLGCSALITLLAMMVSAPYLFIHWRQSLEAVLSEARDTHLGADNLGWLGNLRFYAREFLANTNLPVRLLLLPGIVALARLRQPKALLLAYGTAYWVILSRLALHWERWSLPMMITPLLLAAAGAVLLWQLSKKKTFSRLVVALFLALTAGWYAVSGLVPVIRSSWINTRVLALEYCQQHGITPQNSVYEGYTPFSPQKPSTIFDFDPAHPGETRFVILSSGMYERYQAEPERYQSEARFYQTLRQKADLLAEFSRTPRVLSFAGDLRTVWDYGRHLFSGQPQVSVTGPTIQIFRLRP